jgi:quinoprotein dehydrogenase-associated probable ABC transporter substrate-binding protein
MVVRMVGSPRRLRSRSTGHVERIGTQSQQTGPDMIGRRLHGSAAPLVLCGALAGMGLLAAARAQGNLPSLELIDPKVLRVCGDPRNMPYSNEQSEGFENKLAEMLAAALGKQLAYTWYPSAPGFVRNTLGAYKCDVIMGFPQGNDLVQATNPYYRTSYALVYKAGSGLDGIDTLSDKVLADKRLGIVAGTPPSNTISANGLMLRAKPYPLVVDTRADSSADAMVKDIAAGTIDVGVLWGPMAGYFAARASPPMAVVPLTKEASPVPLIYRIGMGVRASDQEWKRELNRFIEDNQPAINALLLSYGVPLLDESNRPITKANIAQKP